MIKFEGFDLDNIIIDEKSCENTLVFNPLYKTLMAPNTAQKMQFSNTDFFSKYDQIRRKPSNI